ncbi:MAG: nucleotide kinase [Thermoplasmata archaeon]|nr:MAG: nucleotide kinase [Thermoplasmata archaeon]RLF66744.1 MAG: nucleotide kinase [Thermoplasmata archaeon]HHD15318.1 NTPase [Euryarchaeota archaeon]
MSKKIKIGITGLPGAGKTHALRKVVEMLEGDGFKVGGMITDAIIEKGKKVGFMVQDLLTKEERVLARLDLDSEVRFLDYGIDMKALDEVGVEAINRSIDDADVIVIDEVGKLEVESKQFVEIVKEALEADKPLLLTLHKKSRNPLLQDIRRRDDVRILEVTPINKNILPYKIIPLIKEELLNKPNLDAY